MLQQTYHHALVAVSTFNSYFSIKNMEVLFNWTRAEFNNFNVFLMDEASVFNLMALGYDKEKALKVTKKHDSNLKNKVIKSLINIGLSPQDAHNKLILLSQISQSDRYNQAYQRYLHTFETNASFKQDCLDATRTMLSKKTKTMSDEVILLAVQYLLAELPIWLNIPYVLNLPSSVLVYKDLPPSFEKICYNYNLLSPQQEICIKN